MPTYPFTRAKPAGWSAGQTFTAAQANAVDQNAAQAADGLTWTDAVIAKNWVNSQTLTDATVLVYGPTTTAIPQKRWRAFGTSDTANTAIGGNNWQSDSPIAALPATPKCSVVEGDTVLIGGDPGGASAAKIARSTNGVAGTYAAVNSIDTGTAAVDCLIYFASLYVAGLSDGGIETSPDGSAWTDRTVPNSDARKDFVTDGTILLALTSATTDKYITSADGITWVERSLPASKAGWRGAYCSQLGTFFVASQGGTPVLYESSDGINWSTVAHDAALSSVSIPVSYGRVLVIFSGTTVLVSTDGGLTFVYGGSTAGAVSASTTTALYGDGRIVMLDASDVAWSSLRFT